MDTASTLPFLPCSHLATAEQLQAQLRTWNLADELGVREDSQGMLSVYTLSGSLDWPSEWTPEGDDLFEQFEIADFLERVARAGQSVRTQDAGGARMIYLSSRTAATSPARKLG